MGHPHPHLSSRRDRAGTPERCVAELEGLSRGGTLLLCVRAPHLYHGRPRLDGVDAVPSEGDWLHQICQGEGRERRGEKRASPPQ